ncbi:MAG: hypothetical protein AAF993_20790 [Pseudomonadota bacterium]
MGNVIPVTQNSRVSARSGVDIQFLDEGLAQSEQWRMGGWLLQFVQLPAGHIWTLDHRHGRPYVKVITGSLEQPRRVAFGPHRQVSSTRVQLDQISAGPSGALLALFTETPAAPANYASMDQLEILGPNAAAFEWLSFAERFGHVMNDFDGADAYMSGGFHLLDGVGAEISYVNLWTAGKGVNLTTHNHSHPPSAVAPAFAEVHWVFNNGTTQGGMYSAVAQDAAPDQYFPMQRGEEHGPFFHVDATTGRPQRLTNGAVAYPWHGWQAGKDHLPGQAYDVVAAFETNPDFVLI